MTQILLAFGPLGCNRRRVFMRMKWDLEREKCDDVLAWNNAGKGKAAYPYCVLILSTPAPIPTSIMPVRIWLATSTQAWRPDEHWRLRVRTAVVSGKPATRAAARISVAPPPGASTSPTHTSSTNDGSMLERVIMPFRAPAIKSAAAVSLNAPLPPLVKAVRRQAVMTIYKRRMVLLVSSFHHLSSRGFLWLVVI